MGAVPRRTDPQGALRLRRGRSPGAHRYFPDLPHAIFFQHNVETMIWRRHVEHATDPLRRWYFGLQARRMYEYERRVSLQAGHIVAVSATDAAEMRRLFGVTRVSEIPTGVNIEYFLPPAAAAGRRRRPGLRRLDGLAAQRRWRALLRPRDSAADPRAAGPTARWPLWAARRRRRLPNWPSAIRRFESPAPCPTFARISGARRSPSCRCASAAARG